MNFKTLVNTFLSSFNYVNEQGKRDGFLLFSNKPLTQDLEKIAIDLKQHLTTLSNNQDKDELTKCKEFPQLIETVFKEAQTTRVRHAALETCYEYYPPSLGSREGLTVHYTYKNPYRPSKFERELLRGLEATNQYLNNLDSNDSIDFLKITFGSLIENIKHYEPNQVTVNDWSYYP